MWKRLARLADVDGRRWRMSSHLARWAIAGAAAICATSVVATAVFDPLPQVMRVLVTGAPSLAGGLLVACVWLSYPAALLPRHASELPRELTRVDGAGWFAFARGSAHLAAGWILSSTYWLAAAVDVVRGAQSYASAWPRLADAVVVFLLACCTSGYAARLAIAAWKGRPLHHLLISRDGLTIRTALSTAFIPWDALCLDTLVQPDTGNPSLMRLAVKSKSKMVIRGIPHKPFEWWANTPTIYTHWSVDPWFTGHEIQRLINHPNLRNSLPAPKQQGRHSPT